MRRQEPSVRGDDAARSRRTGQGHHEPPHRGLAAPGTNRDHDVAFALDLAGAEPSTVLLADAVAAPACLADAQMLVLAGGFSHADALGAGRMCALELVAPPRRRSCDGFVAAGKPVIGICNGFQTLVRGRSPARCPGPQRRRPLPLPMGDARAPTAAAVHLDRRTSTRSSARSPTARAATCTRTSTRWTPPARWRCATSASNPNGSAATSPASATRPAWSSGSCRTRRTTSIDRQHPLARRGHRGALGSAAVRTGRAPRQGALRCPPSTAPRAVHRRRPRLPDRRDGKVRVSYAAGRPTGCSSPPIDCRRSTASSPRVPVQGSGAQPARRVVVRRRPPTSSPTTCSTCPTRTCSVARSGHAAAGRGRRARAHHRRHVHVALAPVRRRRRATIYGHRLPDGHRARTPRCPTPIVTPTTKAEDGGHDEPLTCADVVDRGLVEPDAVGRRCQDVALRRVRPRPGRRPPRPA